MIKLLIQLEEYKEKQFASKLHNSVTILGRRSSDLWTGNMLLYSRHCFFQLDRHTFLPYIRFLESWRLFFSSSENCFKIIKKFAARKLMKVIGNAQDWKYSILFSQLRIQYDIYVAHLIMEYGKVCWDNKDNNIYLLIYRSLQFRHNLSSIPRLKLKAKDKWFQSLRTWYPTNRDKKGKSRTGGYDF